MFYRLTLKPEAGGQHATPAAMHQLELLMARFVNVIFDTGSDGLPAMSAEGTFSAKVLEAASLHEAIEMFADHGINIVSQIENHE